MALSKLSRSVKDKVVIVTGAASGMGRATAHLFADEGAKVALIDINAEPLSKVVGEIHAEGLDAKGWTLDLSDAEAVGRVIKDVGDHFGGIDVLINNAGISLFAPIDAPDYFAAWDKSFAVMLTAQALYVLRCRICGKLNIQESSTLRRRRRSALPSLAVLTQRQNQVL
jgi:3-oxoacyl-[acyl-carrier protein] reductase